MRIRSVPACVALVATALLAGRASADNPEAKLIEMRSPTVVTVKAALKITGNFGGRSFDHEQDMTTSGIVVDACGFVMIPAGAVAPMPRRRMGGGGDEPDFKVTPTNLRVIFAGDEKEYDAILGATDSKLGLAFVLIRDLKGRTATAVDFAAAAEPKVGDTLYSITRLEQGFDYAPICEEAKVIGHVTKPRAMWAVSGEGAEPPHPLYNADGAVTGIVIYQEGVGDSRSGYRFVLLPLKIATGTIERALKTSKEALEEANAHQEETKEAPETRKEEKGGEAAPEEEGGDK
jgi:hypothetical protein